MPNKSSEGFKNIMVIIDLYTRFAWAIPMKTKTQEEITESFETVFEQYQRIPDYLWFDRELSKNTRLFMV